jgi:CelD/BcsL family acetyltransferase involved in cellulose biosynthesis
MILADLQRPTPHAQCRITRACLVSTNDFSELEKKWDAFFEACSEATIFNSWEWLFSWWQAYAGQKKLRLLIWWNAEAAEIIGIAPLYLAIERVVAGIKCRVLRLIGDGSSDSDLLDFIIRPGYFNAVMADFGEWLTESNDWDVFVLNTVPAESRTPKAVQGIAKKWRMLYRCEDRVCGSTTLPSSFEIFLAERQPRFRTKLRSLLRKFEMDKQLVFENDSADLNRRLQSLYRLHHLRWRGKGREGVFEAKSKKLFYGFFVPRFTRKGWLRFYSLRNEHFYLAHQLCLGNNGRTYLLQEGFDLSDSSASYGQMLRCMVFRFLIEKGEKIYDFLGGYSNHKADWGAVQSKMKIAITARRNWRGEIYFRAPMWREKIASTAKRFVPETIWKMIRPRS